MNDDFNTGWDPYEELMLARNNIQQCAVAINHSTEVMKDLANKYNHQQEVINQLMFQNRKLNDNISRMMTELQVLKATINTQTLK